MVSSLEEIFFFRSFIIFLQKLVMIPSIFVMPELLYDPHVSRLCLFLKMCWMSEGMYIVLRHRGSFTFTCFTCFVFI